MITNLKKTKGEKVSWRGSLILTYREIHPIISHGWCYWPETGHVEPPKSKSGATWISMVGALDTTVREAIARDFERALSDAPQKEEETVAGPARPSWYQEPPDPERVEISPKLIYMWQGKPKSLAQLARKPDDEIAEMINFYPDLAWKIPAIRGME